MRNVQRYKRIMRSLISICFCLFSVKFVAGQEQMPQGYCETYTVSPGDSALSISQKFGLDYESFVSDLTECIGYVEGNVLQIGQKVCLPPYSPGCKFVSTAGEDGGCKYYTVQYGDTLAMIAGSFNMEVADFAALNGFNLTNTVKPMMKLALPPWDESCPKDILSKPVQESQASGCQVYISSGGESIRDIASKSSTKESDLLYYNPEYQNGQQIEPGAQIKLNLWGENCKDNVMVVNRPNMPESIEIPVEAISPGVIVGSDPTLAPTEPASELAPEDPLTTDQIDENLGRTVLDIYLTGLNSKEFSERENSFRETVAQATGVPMNHVDVRFTLLVEDSDNRKLMRENLLQVNTAIYGDELNVYKNLNQSVKSGDFLRKMTEDQFKIVSVAAMQPNEVIVYDSRLEEVKSTDNESSLPIPLGALVGIAAGVVIIIIILVSFCCIKRSQGKKKDIDAKHDKISRQNTGRNSDQLKIKGRGKTVSSGRKEFNLEVFSTTPVDQCTIFVPLSRETSTNTGSFMNVSQMSPDDPLPPSPCYGSLDVSPRNVVTPRRRYMHDSYNQTIDHFESPRVENDSYSRANKSPLAMRSAAILAIALFGATGAFGQTSVCPTYVVQQGDSPYSIAQKFDILQDDLKNAMLACGQDNELLQIGQEICLPGADKPGCANVQSFNNDENCKVYIVQQGDTMESVALALNIYRDTLNSLNTDVIGPGGILQPQKFLKLPPWSNTCGDPNKSGEACRVYIVQQGDFIAGIAAAYGITVDELLSVNPGLDANSVLQNGQPIKIPPFPASCGAGTPSKPPTNTVLKCRGYRIQQGDSINDVAKAFKTTYNDVLAVNPELAGGALVQPGTIVLIPPYDNTCEKPILVNFPDNSTPSSPSSGSGVQIPVTPVPVTPIPVSPVTVPSPVATPNPSPVPSPPVPSPPPSPVTAPPPAQSPELVVIPGTPEVSTATAPSPSSSSSSLSTVVAAATGFLTFLLA